MASMPTFRLVTASAKYGSRKIKSKRRNRRTQNLVPGDRIAPRVRMPSACLWRHEEMVGEEDSPHSGVS